MAGGEGRAAGRTDGGGQMSIEACLSVDVRGLYPGIQTATQSLVGNDAFCRSATAEMSIVRVLPSTALTYVTYDKCVKY